VINLLQENIEIESPRTNCTPARFPQAGLVFCRPVRRQAGTQANTKKPKELFFCQRSE